MVVPIIILLGIPILLAIVYMPPFDQPEEIEQEEIELEEISEESDMSILYYILMGLWTLYLIKIILQIKKGSFKVTQRY
jgi:hypothetical protein